MALLNQSEINEALATLKGWEAKDNFLFKNFEFDNFKSAVAFTVKIALAAEVHNHHPDILIHGWNKVMVKLSTHSENGITGKDIKLANEIQNLFGD